ncbi:MAG: protein phosphatase 2C domain-containing protein [Lentisphaeria bacterium]|nr:protein phosphatase 2C domain-containing protein [Lentisphaeria bacterium]
MPINETPFSWLRTAADSDPGRIRQNNEDSFLSCPRQGVFMVADGMGGAEAGEVASGMLKQEIAACCDHLPEDPLERFQSLADGIRRANRRIKAFAEENWFKGTGSTVVLLAFDPQTASRAIAVCVGDSRLYRLREKKISQLSHDHTIEASLSGVKNLSSRFRGVLTRTVGFDDRLELDVMDIDVKAGDIFLLCSDGLTGMLKDKVIRKTLLADPKPSPAATVSALIDLANKAGGKDNITTIVIRIGMEIPAADTAVKPLAAVIAACRGTDDDAPTPPTTTPPGGPAPDSADAAAPPWDGHVPAELTTPAKTVYLVDRLISAHGEGSVYHGIRQEDARPVALKTGTGGKALCLENEKRHLDRLNHPAIIQCLDSFDTSDGAALRKILVLEYLENLPANTLRGRLRAAGALPLAEALGLFNRYLKALVHMHTLSEPIAHGDLKPSNLYAPENTPEMAKLCDFGSATRFKDIRDKPVGGSPDYLPPEAAAGMFNRNPAQADIFALGCCLYEALTGERAYPRLPGDPDQARQMRASQRPDKTPCSWAAPVFQKYPRLKEVVAKCVDLSPDRRYENIQAFYIHLTGFAESIHQPTKE